METKIDVTQDAATFIENHNTAYCNDDGWQLWDGAGELTDGYSARWMALEEYLTDAHPNLPAAVHDGLIFDQLQRDIIGHVQDVDATKVAEYLGLNKPGWTWYELALDYTLEQIVNAVLDSTQ